MTTARQIQANRLNALKSTGPTSEEGKQRSRANALKHGLAGSGTVLLEIDAAKVDQRLQDWRPSFELRSTSEEWLFEQMVITTVQIDACQDRQFKIRSNAAARALGPWDEDRRDEIEKLAAGIGRRPSLVAHKLLCSKQGCEWLLAQWNVLGQALALKGAWTPEQVATAFNLLGTPLEFRDGQPGEPGETPQDLVARQRERLQTLLTESHAPLDDLRRSMAAQGSDPVPDPELGRLQRYESAAFRRYQWLADRLKRATSTTPQPAPTRPAPERPALVPTAAPPRLASPAPRPTALFQVTPPTPEPKPGAVATGAVEVSAPPMLSGRARRQLKARAHQARMDQRHQQTQPR